MSLIKCSECGSEVSSKAKACPRCGAAPEVKDYSRLLLPIVLLGIIIVSFVQWASVDTPTSPPTQAEREASRKWDLMYTCQNWVKERLRDQKSAEFLDPTSGMPVIDTGSGEFTVLTKVRAANGFGGMTLASYSCRVKVQSDHYQLLALEEVKP